MTAYLIANYRITNPDGYEKYPPAVAPTLLPFDGELLVADFESEVVEGSPHPVSIIVRFPSKEAAHEWYRSEAYQAIVHYRADNTEGSLLFVDG